MKTQESKQKQQIKNHKQQKGQTGNDILAAWVRSRALLTDLERERTERVQRFGRWAPVVEALEQLLEATFNIAEDAVHDRPEDRASVERVRDASMARLRGEAHPSPSLTDMMFSTGLIGRLLQHEDAALKDTGLTETLPLLAMFAVDIRDALAVEHRDALSHNTTI